MTSGLEFHIDLPNETRILQAWGEACALAVARSASTGEPVAIDVVAWDVEAARSWAGDDGVERYQEDPDASVFERIIVRAESQGRVA